MVTEKERRSDGRQRGEEKDEGGETKQKGKKKREGGRRETVHYKRREEDGGRGIGRSNREVGASRREERRGWVNKRVEGRRRERMEK